MKRMIILTGVGSPGHFTVLKHGLHKGDNGSLEQHLGFVEAQIAVNRLRQSILEAFWHHKLPAVQVYASSIYQSKKMRIIRGDTTNLKGFIEVGMVPVISGDIVPDMSMGLSVLSGDQILLDLAKQYPPETVIFGSDVDGIFDTDPKINPDAQLITEISKNKMDDLIKEASGRDASGQMRGKLTEIKNLLDAGFKEIIVLNLTKKGILIPVIKERKGIFTRIY
jgi:isopentenyl phosphate kinase